MFCAFHSPSGNRSRPTIRPSDRQNKKYILTHLKVARDVISKWNLVQGKCEWQSRVSYHFVLSPNHHHQNIWNKHDVCIFELYEGHSYRSILFVLCHMKPLDGNMQNSNWTNEISFYFFFCDSLIIKIVHHIVLIFLRVIEFRWK